MAPPLNHLLELLPQNERDRLLSACTSVDLGLGDVLCRSGDPIRHVYFPVDSFISLITQDDGDPGLEVGLIGFEGMLGASLFLDVAQAPLNALVQGPGTALRITAAAFRRELARSAGLQRVVHTYLYVLMSQLATSASCVRFHEIGPRLARWLLMTEDRARVSPLHVTHEFLAHMLGVRRVSITGAAGALQSQGVIAYRRGELGILDRKRLEAAACSCYAVDQKTYKRFLGASLQRRSRRVLPVQPGNRARVFAATQTSIS